MARKKKSEEETIKEIAKLVAEVTLQDTDPTVVKVVKGSHLTVTHYSDGKTKLEWDDDALLRDVKDAIASLQLPEQPVKKIRKKKAS